MFMAWSMEWEGLENGDDVLDLLALLPHNMPFWKEQAFLYFACAITYIHRKTHTLTDRQTDTHTHTHTHTHTQAHIGGLP